MPKKPIPMPVAQSPEYPSLQEATERGLERQAMSQGEHGAYIACPTPGCNSELVTTRPSIMSNSFEPVQYLKCNECGWTGSIPTGGGY